MKASCCETCGIGFDARRASAKYCSAACRQKALRIRKGQPIAAPKEMKRNANKRHTCPHCGGGFWQPIYGRKRKFCSNSCRVSANKFLQTAIKQLLNRLLHRDYQMGQFYDAQKRGSGYFVEYVNRYGFRYSEVMRSFVERIEYNEFAHSDWNQHA